MAGRKRATFYHNPLGHQLPGPKELKCDCEEFGCFTCMGREVQRMARERAREKGKPYNYHKKKEVK